MKPHLRLLSSSQIFFLMDDNEEAKKLLLSVLPKVMELLNWLPGIPVRKRVRIVPVSLLKIHIFLILIAMQRLFSSKLLNSVNVFGA